MRSARRWSIRICEPTPRHSPGFSNRIEKTWRSRWSVSSYGIGSPIYALGSALRSCLATPFT
jgi:hypothetical protein